jgi:hypothetical protein
VLLLLEHRESLCRFVSLHEDTLEKRHASDDDDRIRLA